MGKGEKIYKNLLTFKGQNKNWAWIIMRGFLWTNVSQNKLYENLKGIANQAFFKDKLYWNGSVLKYKKEFVEEIKETCKKYKGTDLEKYVMTLYKEVLLNYFRAVLASPLFTKAHPGNEYFGKGYAKDFKNFIDDVKQIKNGKIDQDFEKTFIGLALQEANASGSGVTSASIKDWFLGKDQRTEMKELIVKSRDCFKFYHDEAIKRIDTIIKLNNSYINDAKSYGNVSSDFGEYIEGMISVKNQLLEEVKKTIEHKYIEDQQNDLKMVTTIKQEQDQKIKDSKEKVDAELVQTVQTGNLMQGVLNHEKNSGIESQKKTESQLVQQ